MKEEIKTRWVQALRSGRYKQADGTLAVHKEDGEETFCCLGVLCEVAVEDGVLTRFLEKETDEYQFIGYHKTKDFDPDNDHVEYDVLPSVVMEWAGLEDNNPYLEDEARVRDLASEWNDSYHRNFGEIATMVENSL